SSAIRSRAHWHASLMADGKSSNSCPSGSRMRSVSVTICRYLCMPHLSQNSRVPGTEAIVRKRTEFPCVMDSAQEYAHFKQNGEDGAQRCMYGRQQWSPNLPENFRS